MGVAAARRSPGHLDRRNRRTRLAAVLVAAVATAGCSAALPPDEDPARTLDFTGPEDGQVLNADAVADLSFVVEAQDGGLDNLAVLLDGTDVTADADIGDDRLVYTPTNLDDGDRVVTIVIQPAAPADGDDAEDADEGDTAIAPEEPEVLREWAFTVDTTPPEVELTSPDGAVIAGEPVTIAGTTEPGATVEVAGASTTAADDGTFEIVLDDAPEGALDVVATDRAGNRSTDELVLVTVPSRVEVDEIRTVHVSFYGWADRSKRDPILAMIDDGLINSVQLDLKDEAGQIGYDSQVPLAQEIGASMGIYDLEEAVRELHALNVPVIGRIVAFRDPVLAGWAWENGEHDWVIQTPDGEPYAGYGGFTNFAHEDVIEYNLAVAEEAAALGVDHILWDYIRRPDGPVENLHLVGLDVTPEAAIVDFTRRADETIAPYGAVHGVSVYGIAATRAHEIAQDIPGMAEHVDYVAPMVYPSHWGPGEYRVDDPNRQPYDIVYRSLEDFKDAVDGLRARVVPWLEDTSYRAWDRPEQVRQQIAATLDLGIDEWLLWDPHVNYTPSALSSRD